MAATIKLRSGNESQRTVSSSQALFALGEPLIETNTGRLFISLSNDTPAEDLSLVNTAKTVDYAVVGTGEPNIEATCSGQICVVEASNHLQTSRVYISVKSFSEVSTNTGPKYVETYEWKQIQLV